METLPKEERTNAEGRVRATLGIPAAPKTCLRGWSTQSRGGAACRVVAFDHDNSDIIMATYVAAESMPRG